MKALAVNGSPRKKGNTALLLEQALAAFIWTMNITEEALASNSQAKLMERTAASVARLLGNCETQAVCDTYQFEDYSKYMSTIWDPEAKARRRKEVFPNELKQAFDLGARLAGAAGN
jgi:hypothetical protein